MMGLQLYEMLAAAALLLALATVVQRRVITCVGLYAAQLRFRADHLARP